MKKGALILLIILCAAAGAISCARAETQGYGLVNNTEVALRKSPGGQKLIRLQKDTCVWIKDTKTDGQGNLWYEVNAGYNDEGRYRNRTGWIKAEFVDAGDRLWHGVRSVAADTYGLMALRQDGTAECVCDQDNTELRKWAAGLRNIRQVSLSWLGWGYYALDGDGTVFGSDGNREKGVRLICDYGYPYSITEDNRLLTGGTQQFTWVYPREVGSEQLARVTAMTNSQYRLLLLTDEGRVYAACSEGDPVYFPEPDWEQWTDAAGIDAGIISFSGGRPYSFAFAAVRRDGTVLAAPDELAAMIGDWQGMKKIRIGYKWVLGLKEDGTAIAAGPAGSGVPDVSGWSGIRDIGNGGDYLVGVKEDGSLVFAEEHVFLSD